MRTTVAKWSEWIARGAVALGFALIGQTHAATITAAGVALTQGSGSSTCNYSQANESLSGDWSFTCGAGPATITISPNVNGTACVTYGTMSEDMSGNWTIAGCVSAAPTLTLDAPVQSSSTYPSNVPFTLKATATPPTGRTISSVEFFHDGVSIHTGALSGSQYVWDWSPPSGTYQVTVRATDNTGAVVETSPAVQMTFAPAVGPATIYYIHPDHLGTPREITRASDNQIVWRWDNTESFGNSQPNENPSGLGTFAYNLRFPGQYFDAETGTNYNYFRDYDPSIGRYVESDPIGLEGGLNTYAYVEGNPLLNADTFGLAVACTKKLMLVTAYNDKGPGKDWNFYKPKVKGGSPGSVGPGTIAMANSNPTPYQFGCHVKVLDKNNRVTYEGDIHDTGAGWDPKHHNVAPDEWIDIWKPGNSAIQWGKQWRMVEICCETTCP